MRVGTWSLLVASMFSFSSPAGAASLFVDYQGSGVGTDQRYAEQFGGPPVQYTNVFGNFSFDLALARPFGDGLLASVGGLDQHGREIDILASLSGDRIYFDVRTVNPQHADQTTTLTMSLLFDEGYLGSVFPSSIDFARLISARYTAEVLSTSPLNERFTSMGSLTGITFSQIPDADLSAFTNIETTGIAAVPEPGTWAMMLLGFASVGLLVRRRRRAALQAAR